MIPTRNYNISIRLDGDRLIACAGMISPACKERIKSGLLIRFFLTRDPEIIFLLMRL